MKRVLAVAAAMAIPAMAFAQAGGADVSKAKLKTPSALTEKAPETFKTKFDTSKGPFIIEVHRDWAPLGADRFYNLVKNGFYDEARFFRVIPNFMVQFGMNADPAVTAAWRSATLKDDPAKQSNKTGYVTFAKTSAPNSRGTQVFVNYKDNGFLDSQGGQRVDRDSELRSALPQGVGSLSRLLRRAKDPGHNVAALDEGVHRRLAEVPLTHNGYAHDPSPDISYIISLAYNRCERRCYWVAFWP